MPDGICGTPGCTLPDFHTGLCAGQKVAAKRPRVTVQPPPRPRPPPPPPKPKPPPKPAAPRPLSPPPEQCVLPNGLHKFYHPLRWGVPLPAGPVAAASAECDERAADELWRHEQVERRLRSRPSVTAADGDLMLLWNKHVAAQPPLASDRALPGACRQFARAHAAQLTDTLRRPFVAHLVTLFEHKLLEREDVRDCLALIDSAADAVRSPSRRPLPPSGA